ncbi:putative Monocarboxylate transporter 3 [Hypsibius exemplaris]|uniref:Monocarboxylate transporter 3 n=1 Tax=Hypsibius exemplaris TaxID=2072580 RepID=A0A1W0WX01_HYPEX|nr:putative Monocarboxylate transporter 3 [Hypsibius exemplaris]
MADLSSSSTASASDSHHLQHTKTGEAHHTDLTISNSSGQDVVLGFSAMTVQEETVRHQESTDRGTVPLSVGRETVIRRQRRWNQIDSGWAWVIMAAVAALSALWNDGYAFSLNILFPVFLDRFREGDSNTAWIGATFTGVMLLSGPLNGYLINRFGARIVCVVGVVIAAGGIVAGAFAQTLTGFILTMSLLTGYGFGCVNESNLFIMVVWFRERRSLAMGLMNLFSALGQFFLPNLIPHLLELYAWQGCFLIVGGIIFQGVFFGLLLKPAPEAEHAKRRFDIRILKNWHYDVMLLSNFCYHIGFFPVMMYIQSRAEQFTAKKEAAFLKNIIGFADLGGRLLGTILLHFSGRFRMNKIILTAIVEAFGAVAILTSIWAKSYETQIMFCVAYGLVWGYNYPALGIVLAEVVPMEKLAVACGFFTFAFGLAGFTGGPLSGFVADSSGKNYVTIFLVQGALVGGAATCMFVTGLAHLRARTASKQLLLISEDSQLRRSD